MKCMVHNFSQCTLLDEIAVSVCLGEHRHGTFIPICQLLSCTCRLSASAKVALEMRQGRLIAALTSTMLQIA